jgi:hypothetical protein
VLADVFADTHGDAGQHEQNRQREEPGAQRRQHRDDAVAACEPRAQQAAIRFAVDEQQRHCAQQAAGTECTHGDAELTGIAMEDFPHEDWTERDERAAQQTRHEHGEHRAAQLRRAHHLANAVKQMVAAR